MWSLLSVSRLADHLKLSTSGLERRGTTHVKSLKWERSLQLPLPPSPLNAPLPLSYATSIIFVATKYLCRKKVLFRQAYFCRDKRRVLSRQTQKLYLWQLLIRSFQIKLGLSVLNFILYVMISVGPASRLAV